MNRRVLLPAVAAAALLYAGVSQAQSFTIHPSPHTGSGSWNFDIGGQLARPQGEFRSQVDRAFGFGAAVRHHFSWFAPLGLRGDFAFLNYGSEKKRVPLSPTVNRVFVDMSTSNNIVVASGGPELAVTRGPLRPYVFAFAGYSYFFTESSVDDADGGSFARSTNFGDGGLAMGWGGGLRAPLGVAAVRVAIDAGARLTRNGTRTYLRRGDIVDLPDGTLQLNTRRTNADFLQFHVGVSLTPRRR